ncbi:MAG TPA: hypothetical protein VKE95_02665 [Burkholderiales bacterium]|nr:hypothetical protein [Burkholderiales bacterium]
MSLRIARLRLRLPAGYAPRAEAIARAIAGAAAQIPLGESRSYERLTLQPIAVGANASNGEVAGAAARGLAARLGAKP